MKPTLLNQKTELVQNHTRRPMEDAYRQCSTFSMVPPAQIYTAAQVQVSFPPSLSLKIWWVTKAQSGRCKHLDSCV